MSNEPMSVLAQIKARYEDLEAADGYYFASMDECAWVYKKTGKAYRCQFCFVPDLYPTFTSRRYLLKDQGAETVEMEYDYGLPYSDTERPSGDLLRLTDDEYQELCKYLKKKAKEL